MKRIAALLALCSCALAESYLRLEADGRTYTLDTDSTSVRRAMRPVSVAKAAAKLPAWLFPARDAAPAEAHYDVSSGIASAIFSFGPDQLQAVEDWYKQALALHGYRVSTLTAGAGGQQITGALPAAIITVTVLPDARSDSTTTRATYAPRVPPAGLRFTALWYDDSAGILRLRETSSGDEYDLDKRAILESNLNRPGAVESKGAALPEWFPVYPGAASYPKEKISLLMTPTAVFLTRDSTRQVYNFYLEALRDAGARVTENGTSRNMKVPGDETAHIIAFRGDDEVEIRIGKLIWMFQGIGVKTPEEKIGIAIRYTVPKR